MKNCRKHDWSSWTETKRPMIVSEKWPQPPKGSQYVQRVQHRHCLKCGYTQEETLD